MRNPRGLRLWGYLPLLMLPAGGEQSRNMLSSIQSGSEGLGLPSFHPSSLLSGSRKYCLVAHWSPCDPELGGRRGQQWAGVDSRTGVSSGETTVPTCCSVAAPPGPALHQDPRLSASLVSPLLEGGLALLLIRHPELPCFDFHCFSKSAEPQIADSSLGT